MTDLKAAQEMMEAAVAARGTEDPEITSVKRILKLLDKTAKSNRTYGSTNPVAQKFSQQLFEEMTGHLTSYERLSFLIQRSDLVFKDIVVYQTDKDSGSENIAFKLYADGIRELVFHQGLAQEELSFFLDSLWGSTDPNQDDDDIVTRLWSRNLSTITLVTAEELSQTSTGGDGSIRIDGVMNSSDSTLRELLDKERSKNSRPGNGSESGQGKEGGAANRPSRFQSGLAGYEVSDEELAALATEIEAERRQDSLLYLLDLLTVILASEKSPVLLTKLLNLWSHVVDSLVREGKWTVLENVLGLLHETDSVRPDLGEEHRQQLMSILDGLGRAEKVKAVETYLNRTPDANTQGLSTILLMMKPDSVPALCSLLANLTSGPHQGIVSEALMTLAKDQPEPVLRGLADRRPTYVRNLLSILMKWNDPKFADPVEKLIRHPDVQVRKDVVRAIGSFRPSGNGSKLVSLVSDTEESVRLAALKLLMSGQYTSPFSVWSPIVSAEEFMDRPLSERRVAYHAMRATCGDEAIPYWESLMTEWSWTNRKKREELATLAAEALGKLATPAAVATLEVGVKKGNAAVRQACNMALSQVQKLQRGKQAAGAAG